MVNDGQVCVKLGLLNQIYRGIIAKNLKLNE